MADPVTYAETCTVSHSASNSCQSSIHLKSVLSTPLPCPRPCSPARLNRPPTQRTVQTGAIEHSERLSIAYFLLRFKIQLLQLPQLPDPSQEEEGKPLRHKPTCPAGCLNWRIGSRKAFRLVPWSQEIYTFCWLKRKRPNLENGMILARRLASS